MDDLRFRWLKESTYAILDVDAADPAFEDFLEGDDGANELIVAKFLNEASTNVDNENALVFYKEVFEELREEQVEISTHRIEEIRSHSMFHILAEEEWIEDQLATNPDFDPNEVNAVTNGGTEEQHDPASTVAAHQAVTTSVPHVNRDNATQAHEGVHPNGEAQVPEVPSRPKRYVD